MKCHVDGERGKKLQMKDWSDQTCKCGEVPMWSKPLVVDFEVHVVNPKPQVDVVQGCSGENAPSAGVVDVHPSQRCGRHQPCAIWKGAAHCADHFGSSMASRTRQPREGESRAGEGGRRRREVKEDKERR